MGHSGTQWRAVLLGGMLAVTGCCLAGAAPAADSELLLREAAQHFADLEDDQAKAILDDLSAQGVVEADVLRGYLYADPLFVGRDYETAVTSFDRAAAAGNEEAIFQLAEARFWPEYSNWTLTPDEKATRPSAEDAFGLLLRAVQDRPGAWGEAGARYWRLAWLCTFGGYDCGDALTDEVVRKGSQQLGNLRMIVNAFQMIDVLRNSDADTRNDPTQMQAYIALGMASADPFMAAIIAGGSIWRDVEHGDACPQARSPSAASRLLALEGNAIPGTDVWGWEDFRRCFDAEQEAVVREDLSESLDKLIREYSNQDTWHLRTCYRNSQAATFGDCLIHAVRDHYFACTKLSMIDYFRARYKIYYANSDRYARCRNAMISARQG